MSSNKKYKILCFADHYLPGFKAGGPIKSIQNITNNLKDDFEFYIVTRDRDLNDSEAYDSLEINNWVLNDNVNVYYTSPGFSFCKRIFDILKKNDYDIIYLNSFFSPKFTGLLLLYRKFGFYSQPVLIAPRGELSKGALSFKSFKKKIYLKVVKIFGLYNNLIWHASSQYDVKNIKHKMGDQAIIIYIAPNLQDPKIYEYIEKSTNQLTSRNPGPLRIVFISRISRSKNLDFLIRILASIKTSLSLSIYGPLEDKVYWKECKNLLNHLPNHITFSYNGALHSEEVKDHFSIHDLFVFPTKGENYGHVIFESLSAGTPVMSSDQVPWKLDKSNALIKLSLENESEWIEEIQRWADFTNTQLIQTRTQTFKYLRNYIDESSSVSKNKNLFNKSININNLIK